MSPSRRDVVITLAAAVVPLATARQVLAQTPVHTAGAVDSYVTQTLALGAVALKTSQIAAEKATNVNVKTFAGLEIAEQNTIAGILQAAAPKREPVELPPELQQQVDALSSTPAGENFDLAYVEGQIQGHNQLLAVQQTLSGETSPSIEAITARLAEQGVASHIAMLGLIQQLMGSQRIQQIQQGEEPGAKPQPEGEPPADK